MLTKTIELSGGAKVTLRRVKIRDRLMMNSIYNKLGIDKENLIDFAAKQFLTRLIVQAEIEGDLGFALPAITDSKEDMISALEKLLDLDGADYDVLIDALHEVDKPLNDPDLLPAEDVPENLDEAAE